MNVCSRGHIDDARLGPRRDIAVFGPAECEPTADEIIRRAGELLSLKERGRPQNMHVQNFLNEKDSSMNATRCKMKLVSISEAYSNGVAVKFQPVTGGSE